MALTEQLKLAQVAVSPESSTVNVRWDNVIYRDDLEVSRTIVRKAYGVEQKDQFLAEVEHAAAYVVALGW